MTSGVLMARDLTRLVPTTELEEACLAFPEAGSPVPSVIWSPDSEQLLNPLIERFYRTCLKLCDADGQFRVAALDPTNFESLIDWMMVVRIDQATGAFVYAHYGRGIADHFGRDMTGATTDQFGGHISQFFTAAYRDVARRREWVLTEHEPPRQVFVCAWRRLLLPLIGKNDDVEGFLAINVPENPLRAGLDLIPEPVFVLDRDRHVRFLNTFGRTLFDLPATQGTERNFEDVTGVELCLPWRPEDMFASGIVENQVHKVEVCNTIDDEFLVMVSGALHSGRAFYIVMLRLLIGSFSPK